MPVLDLYNLKEFNKELVSQILSIYLTDGRFDLDELIKAVNDEDFLLAGKKAHKLTGSSKTVGAIQVAQIAEELEVIIKSNPKKLQKDSLEKLVAAFTEVKDHIHKNDLMD